jgi:hypothetical protein
MDRFVKIESRKIFEVLQISNSGSRLPAWIKNPAVLHTGQTA